MEYQMNEINFHIALVWAEGGRVYRIDAGDPMLKIKKCCEAVRAPPMPEKSENQLRSFDIPSIMTQTVEK